MSALDATGFLVSLLSMSLSVSLLLGGLLLCKKRLLPRYRARTLYLLGLLLTVLLLCPWRPSLLMPRFTLPAAQVVDMADYTKEVSLSSTNIKQTSGEEDGLSEPGTTEGNSKEATAAQALGDTKPQAASSQAAVPLTLLGSPISWGWAAFTVWLLGALIVLLFQTVRHMRFIRLIQRWKSPVSQEVHAALAQQCAYLGIKTPPACVTPCVQTPTVAGLLRPMLLLPVTRYESQQLRLMLTHELIHLKHGHLWGKALGCLVLAVHWFNPLMPFLMREMGGMCEMACDEAVLTFEDTENRSTYVDAILNAALRTKAVRTPLCSPLSGGVTQMNQIKQRITLLTPFRKRRAGTGFIACMLALALLTGSVLAQRASASSFAIPESDWFAPVSDYMPQEHYDLIMSMQTPGWEEMSTQAYAKQIMPQLPKLKAIFDRRFKENRFMRHLEYSVAEARNPRVDSYKVQWSSLFWQDDQAGSVIFFCDINWKYLDNVKMTNGERNRLLDDALMRADRAARAVDTTQMRDAVARENAGDELEAKLNAIAKELGENSLSIWFTGVIIGTDLFDDSYISKEQRELISLLTPEGYLNQTAKEYQTYLEKYQDRFDHKAKEAMQCGVNRAVEVAFLELTGLPTSSHIGTVDLSMLPAWTMRGTIEYTYQLDWKTVDPDHITVGQRQDAMNKMATRIQDTVAEALWEAISWEAFDKALKERLPRIAQEESTAALTLTVSDVGLELWPLATEEYIRSQPVHVLKAFANACRDQDAEKMAAACAPAGIDPTIAGDADAREEVLKALMEMNPYVWTFGDVRKVPGKDDVVTVDVTFYLYSMAGTGELVQESRQAKLTQIDGKWYLEPESLMP